MIKKTAFVLAAIGLGVLLSVDPTPAKVEAQTDTATLVIELAPNPIFTPRELLFNKKTYDQFVGGNAPKFNRATGAGNEVVSVEKVYQNGDSDERGAYYRITISNIEKRHLATNPTRDAKGLLADAVKVFDKAQAYTPPPANNLFMLRRPYPFRLTFVQPVDAAKFESVVTYVSEKSNKDNVFFGDSNCSTLQNSRGYLCLKEVVKVTNPNTAELRLALNQKIELSGVYLAGNIAAPILIKNIRLTPNAIAVGGSLNQVSGNQLTQYLTDYPQSILKWASVKDQLAELFAKRVRGTTSTAHGSITGAKTWNLNTTGNDPFGAGAATTFTSPPEGKLWSVNQSITFGSAVTFNGSGTIAVDGDITFNGPVNCLGDKRLGIIASGKITFNNTHVECGAYVALGSVQGSPGSITFTSEPPEGGDVAKGIFVARGNILIPEAASSPFYVDYDRIFAEKPTILFRELLQILVNATS